MNEQKTMIKNFALIAVIFLAVVVGTAAIVKASRVEAVGGGQTVIDRLVEQFDLNEDEVSDVFDELRTERQQQRQELMESRLDQAVDDGIITLEQKQALLDKKAEMQQVHEQHRAEMQAWVTEQGIDPEALAPYVGFGHHRGFGGWGMGLK